MLHKGPYRLRPSIALASLLAWLHALAILVLCASTLSLLWLLLFLPCAWLSLRYYLQHYIYLQHPTSIVSFSFTDKGYWLLRQANGEEYLNVLLPESIITTHIILLHFQVLQLKRRYKIPIFFDGLDKESHRRLRVLLNNFPDEKMGIEY